MRIVYDAQRQPNVLGDWFAQRSAQNHDERQLAKQQEFQLERDRQQREHQTSEREAGEQWQEIQTENQREAQREDETLAYKRRLVEGWLSFDYQNKLYQYQFQRQFAADKWQLEQENNAAGADENQWVKPAQQLMNIIESEMPTALGGSPEGGYFHTTDEALNVAADNIVKKADAFGLGPVFEQLGADPTDYESVKGFLAMGGYAQIAARFGGKERKLKQEDYMEARARIERRLGASGISQDNFMFHNADEINDILKVVNYTEEKVDPTTQLLLLGLAKNIGDVDGAWKRLAKPEDVDDTAKKDLFKASVQRLRMAMNRKTWHQEWSDQGFSDEAVAQMTGQVKANYERYIQWGATPNAAADAVLDTLNRANNDHIKAFAERKRLKNLYDSWRTGG